MSQKFVCYETDCQLLYHTIRLIILLGDIQILQIWRLLKTINSAKSALAKSFSGLTCVVIPLVHTLTSA